MNETDDWGAAGVSGAPPGGGLPISQESALDDTVIFLAASPPTVPLAEMTLYRPGALVAVIFLIPPAASALILAALAPGMGAPIWLPLTLLLWVPIMLVGWVALRGVRLTREEIAFGRPLRAWLVIPLSAIERLESHGPRWTLVTTSGRKVSFMPALLSRGAQLRRRLLLSLPASALAGEARAEARRLLGGTVLEDSDAAVDALIIRPPRWMLALGVGLALAGALAAGALIVWEPAISWVALAPGVLAALSLAASLWLAQEVFISDRGVIARFLLIRVTRSVAWDDLNAIERAPGDVALILRARRALICAGPGLLARREARRMRETVNRYALERGTPVTPRAHR